MREMELSLFNAKTAKSHYSHVIVLAGLIAKGKKKKHHQQHSLHSNNTADGLRANLGININKKQFFR